jgi:hypothetical protein
LERVFEIKVIYLSGRNDNDLVFIRVEELRHLENAVTLGITTPIKMEVG